MGDREGERDGRGQAPPLRSEGVRLVLMVAALLIGAATGAHAAAPTAADRELLAQADLQRAAPAAFRAEVRVEPLAGPGAMAFELWRSGDQALLRFTDPKRRGKAFLQHGQETWFLTRGAHPVKLG